jgi:hypothetical protein
VGNGSKKVSKNKTSRPGRDATFYKNKCITVLIIVKENLLKFENIFYFSVFSGFWESRISSCAANEGAKKAEIVLCHKSHGVIISVIPCCEGSYACWLSAKKFSPSSSEAWSRAREEYTPALDCEVRRFP